MYVKHQNISSPDYSLYNHFFRIQREKILKGGQSFIQEVNEFKRLNAHANWFCKKRFQIMKSLLEDLSGLRREARKTIKVPKGLYNSQFTLTGGDCILMALGENPLTSAIKASNYDSHCRVEKQNRNNSCPRSLQSLGNYCQSNAKEFVWKNIPHSVIKSFLFRDMDVIYPLWIQ